MIIDCINCNKKFNVDQNLIPENGRLIQCGSCNHSWHYKIKKILLEPLALEENINKIEINKSVNFEINPKHSTIEKKTAFKKEIKNYNSNKVFSYLIVFIISIITLVILIDTLKSPLINIFPGLEILLFNLFETLKDIKLFIIDLT
jgi:predicted Zn finger-like uncharacterized protein|tara:strand:- start:193 stop:630 length:438 start_codon:yes stop_codon:yes gene_type:complete